MPSENFPTSPSGSPPVVEGEEESIHLTDLWQIVRRRVWIVGLALAATVATTIWVTSGRPVVFQSQLAIQVSDPTERGRSLNVVRNITLNELHVDPVQAELEVLRTRPIAHSVVDLLGLRLVPTTPDLVRSDLFMDAAVDREVPYGSYTLEYSASGDGVELRNQRGAVVARGHVGEPLEANGIRFTPLPQPRPSRQYPLVVQELDLAAWEVIGGLSASAREATNVIDLRYTGRDAVLAPQILGAAADALRRHGVEKNRTLASSTVLFLQEQLDESYAELRSALDRVQAFKSSRSITNLTTEEQTVFQQIRDYQNSAEDLALETAAYSALISQLQSGGIARSELQRMSALPTLNANSSIQFYLRQLLTLQDQRHAETSGGLAKDSLHPDVRGLDGRIREAESNLLQTLKSQLSVVQERQQRLDGAVEQGREQLSRFPGLETELSNLELQKDIYMQNHQYLLSELQRAQLAKAVVAPYVDIIDPATPATKIGRNRTTNLSLGVVLGLLLGVGFAFFLEYLDRTIRNSSDIERQLGMPTLALIPRLPRGRRRKSAEGDSSADETHGAPAFAADPLSPAAEAYRSLQVNLVFSRTSDDPLRTLTITSAGPGEGKSTTALNLAAVLAQQGKRTLLIDGDLRNPRLHKALGLLRSPGLSNLMVGDSNSYEAIREEVLPGLDVLPAGPFPPNPAELFDSTAIPSLLEELRDRYDWILVDSPPILAVNDAALLGRQTDGLVFVVRAGDTEQDAAEHAVERLRRVGVRIVGAVLNEVDRSSSSDAAYTEYYYSYAPESRSKTRMQGLRKQLAGIRIR